MAQHSTACCSAAQHLEWQVALSGQRTVPVTGGIVHGNLALCFLNIHNTQGGEEERASIDGHIG